MNDSVHSAAVHARQVAPNKVRSILPAPFSARLQGREKRRLGEVFGLENFGVNIVRLEPKGISSLRHCHARQDEFVYILEGQPTLNTNRGPVLLSPGMCAGFKAGTGLAHNLSNHTDQDVWYLEIGDRSANDEVDYPEEDLRGRFVDGAWIFMHKDGSPV